MVAVIHGFLSSISIEKSWSQGFESKGSNFAFLLVGSFLLLIEQF